MSVDFINKVNIVAASTRLFMLLLFGLYMENTNTQMAIYRDNFHHYQLGFILLITYFLLSKTYLKIDWFLVVGLAFIVEEYSVLLYDLNTPHFHYLSILEMMIFIVFMFCVWLINNVKR